LLDQPDNVIHREYLRARRRTSTRAPDTNSRRGGK
jgi:hypothetical protein